MRLNSAETDKVIFALAAACAEIPAMKATRTNESYQSSYTGLDDVLSVIKPILMRHGLWTTYDTRRIGKTFRIEQRIHHVESKQFKGNKVTFDVQTGAPHEIASLMTYGRRYLLSLALDLQPGEDDDGNAAQITRLPPATSLPSTTLADFQARQRALTEGTLASVNPSGQETKIAIPAGPSPAVTSPAAALSPSAPPPSGPSDSIDPTKTPAGTALVPTEPTAAPPQRQEAEKARVNQSRVQVCHQMNLIYGQYRLAHGKEKAESLLQELVGTTYLKFVTPDKYEIVIAGVNAKLASTPAA